jgi:uncharacterized protein YggT (Ycf19 family)
MYILLENIDYIRLLIYMYVFLADLISYLYLLLKIYRVLCFSKITFDQLPVLNPYKWPFSFIRIITKPYFKFWSKLLPNLKIGSGSYDISTIVGLEMLNTLISVSYKFRLLSLAQAQKIILKNS